MSRDYNVSLEIKLIESNSQGGVLAVQITEAVDTFTPPEKTGKMEIFSIVKTAFQKIQHLGDSEGPLIC